VVVGVPGQVVVRSKPAPPVRPDLAHDQLPDTIGLTLAAVMQRLEKLEDQMEESEPVLEPAGAVLYDSGYGTHHRRSAAPGHGNGGHAARSSHHGNERITHGETGPGEKHSEPLPHAPDHGVWRGEDFMI
jgi:serine O-acetyltransferase